MTWKAYQVVFKLKSPMHIGCGKIGNVQRTRPYVTGRVFWGALTMRLTRDKHQPATESEQYQAIGDEVHQQLAYTYFYPATKSEDGYKIALPWQNDNLFRRRFLSSYASTALMYPQQAADEGLLHEVEFISPRTLDRGEQVYLVGYVFEKEDCDLAWQEACQKLQMGGERGYGWGDLQYVKIEKITDTKQLFNTNYSWQEQNGSLVIQTLENSRLLAHTKTTDNLSAQGEIEPLVGREWRSHNKDSQGNRVNYHAGQYIEYSGLCWVPGSVAERSLDFVIRDFGIWDLPT